jgi:hypothetical protein
VPERRSQKFKTCILKILVKKHYILIISKYIYTSLGLKHLLSNNFDKADNQTTQKISKFTVVLFSHIAKLYLPYDFSDIKYNILDIKNIVFLEKLHYNVS